MKSYCVIRNLKSVFQIVENIVRKKENTGNQHWFLFLFFFVLIPSCEFSVSFQRKQKVAYGSVCGKRTKHWLHAFASFLKEIPFGHFNSLPHNPNF